MHVITYDAYKPGQTRHSTKRVLDFFKKISSLPSAFTGALGKDISKKNSLPSAVSGVLGKVFSKKKSLLSARSGTLGKEFFLKKTLCRVQGQVAVGIELKKIKKTFAECQIGGTRQRGDLTPPGWAGDAPRTHDTRTRHRPLARAALPPAAPCPRPALRAAAPCLAPGRQPCPAPGRWPCP